MRGYLHDEKGEVNCDNCDHVACGGDDGKDDAEDDEDGDNDGGCCYHDNGEK